MKNKLLFLSGFFLIALSICRGQYVVQDGSELLKLKELPQEKVFIDHTGPLVFSG